MNIPPPKHALRFLRWFCREDFIEEIEGDLIEIFQHQYKETPRSANWTFIWQVLLHFRPSFIKAFKVYPLNHSGMYKNYLKIAWRSMFKQKLHTSINIGGLTLGLSAFIIIALFIQHELSFDRFHEDADQIYRIYKDKKGSNYLGTNYSATTPAGLSAVLLEEYPEVSHSTTLIDQSAVLAFEENSYYEKGLWADGNLFKVFTYSFLEGNPATALQNPKSIVLTTSLAHRIFGDENPVGKSIRYQNNTPYEVTGVIQDLPANSSFKLSFIASVYAFEDYLRDKNFAERWNSNSFHTFFRLEEGVNPIAFQDKLPALLEKYGGAKQSGLPVFSYLVQPLSDLHLETNVSNDIGTKGNDKYVRLFSIVAILVLLLACINYMNLAIARSINRAKEVGLRKVIGARRGQLMMQFIGESVLVTVIALLLSLLLVYYLLPFFGHLFERSLDLGLFDKVYMLPLLVVLVIIVGVLSGSYPAFFMSSLRPAQALKGKGLRPSSRINKQQLLIIGQYTTCIALAICSLVIYKQFQFIQSTELGYEREHIVTIPIQDDQIYQKIDVLKKKWLDHHQILKIATSSSLPTNIDAAHKINYDYAKGEEQENSLHIYHASVDLDYLDVFSIELLAGRNFSRTIASDLSDGRIINQTAAKALGWTPEEAIGKQFLDIDRKAQVIGVISDFHMHSMHLEIKPLMLSPDQQFEGFLSVKISPDNLAATLLALENGMGEYSAFPFEFSFLDETFNQLYKAEQQSGKLLSIFTCLSILIASMGLFGMATLIAAGRSKEIGIRKVLGASVNEIIGILSADFLKMVLWSFLVAVPIAWYAMNQWLHGFAYRINIAWWIFAIAGLGAFTIAFLTVGSQSLKVALANPLTALKNE